MSVSIRRFPRVLVLLAVCLAVSVACGAETRTWTDSTGKFKIEGAFESVKDDVVFIKRPDGSLLKIPLAKLSEPDQKFVAEQAKSPFEATEPSPFESADATNMPTAGPREATPDWSSATTVALMASNPDWKLETPIAATGIVELKPRAIPLPPKSNFFEKCNGVVLSASKQRAVIGYQLDEPKPAGQTRVVLCDLATGKVLLATTTPGKSAPVALSDDGLQVLMRRNEWGFGNQDRLELWQLSPKGIVKSLQWTPHGDVQGGGRDIKWAAFLDGERIATLGGAGTLAIWRVATATPLCKLAIDGGSVPALSPDRKRIAFSTGKLVGVLDIESQEVVASQTTQHTPWPQLCFSPDASQLACLAHGKLLVWNFADGELYREVPLTGLNVGQGGLVWPHEKYLLLGGSQLFDLENQVPVWTYRGHEQMVVAGPLCAFVVADGQDKPGALVLSPVPSANFERTLAAAMQAPDFFVLKPGTTVRLVLDGLPDPADREKVRETLTRKLQERECQVGPTGSIDLVATAQPGEEREVSYHGIGFGFGSRTHKVRDFISRLSFVYQGAAMWQTQGGSVPGFIQLKEGETIEQVLRRSERPNYGFYDHVELPKRLMKTVGRDGLGVSQVTTAGVQ